MLKASKPNQRYALSLLRLQPSLNHPLHLSELRTPISLPRWRAGGRGQPAGVLSAAQLSGTAQLDAQAHCLSSLFTSHPSTPLFHPVRFLAPTSPHPSPPPGLACLPPTKVFCLAWMDVLALQPLSHAGLSATPQNPRGESFSSCRSGVEMGRVPAHCSWRCWPVGPLREKREKGTDRGQESFEGGTGGVRLGQGK